jgi:hypothetical protein
MWLDVFVAGCFCGWMYYIVLILGGVFSLAQLKHFNFFAKDILT